MSRHCVRSGYCRFAVLAIGMICGNSLAVEIVDVSTLGQPGSSSQPMAGFYEVAPGGGTTPIDPVKSGLALTGSPDFQAGHEKPVEKPPDKTQQSGEESRKKKSGAEKPRQVRLRITRKQPERNLADQFRCERHGFYYTNDGRCILPAYGRMPVMPQLLPSPGRPPMTMD